ncbi:MAG: class I SAM-dependent methyltransferase, partial [Solirubrobacteraceae bacterium]
RTDGSPSATRTVRGGVRGVLGADVFSLLRSPRTGEELRAQGARLVATPSGQEYPVIGAIPILIDDATSVFRIADFEARHDDVRPFSSRLCGAVLRRLPDVSHNLVARENYARFLRLLRDAGLPRRPRILVIGGSIAGAGFSELLDASDVDLVETDVAFGPRTQVICDGHALPFAGDSFDGVICQAVLEHVADPPRVVREIYRVLALGGIVYSEIPFMQAVHEGVYDFTRYTLVGHRRLYREFDSVAIGALAGPGMSLAWAIKYFFGALAGDSHRLELVLRLLARLSFFWLKYLDPFLLRGGVGVDAASGTYFLGRKRTSALSDRQVLEEFGSGQGHQIHRS